MKLIYLLLTAALLTIHSAGYSQQITYSGENVALKTIFSAIQKQTGYGFFYDPTLLKSAKPVTIKVKNLPVSEVLDLIFKNQALEYSIENKTILVAKKKSPNAALKAPSANDKTAATIVQVKTNPGDNGQTLLVNGTGIDKTTDPGMVSSPKSEFTKAKITESIMNKASNTDSASPVPAESGNAKPMNNGSGNISGNAKKSFFTGALVPVEEHKIIFGFKGGMNKSRIYATEIDGSKSGYIGTELYGGFFADRPMSSKLNLGTELIFSFTESYHFIELPIHLKYKIIQKWNLMAGPKLDMIADGSLDYDYDKFKRLGVSAEIGSQYQFNQLFFAEARYAYGLSPQINSRGFGFYNGNRNTFRLGLGINFGKNEVFGKVSKDLGPMRIRFALNTGAALTSGYDIVLGSDLRIQKNISSATAGMLTVGYNHYSLKSGFNETNIAYFPIKAGLKLYQSNRIYIAPELGFAIGTKSEALTIPFIYAAGIGTETKNGFDISLRYEKMTGRIHDYLDEIKRPAQLALRVEYGFNLNSGKAKSGEFNAAKEEPRITGKRQKAVFAELLGNGAGVSGNFDMRFKPDRNDGFGFRAGTGISGRYITLPLGINYIVGKNRSGFETGIGISPTIYTGANPRRFIGPPLPSKRLDAVGFLSAGYRLQSYNGFMLRANGSIAYSGSYFFFGYPGLSIGYSFK